jgi:hypothetical protein
MNFASEFICAFAQSLKMQGELEGTQQDICQFSSRELAADFNFKIQIVI